jgi:hypothetical protein
MSATKLECLLVYLLAVGALGGGSALGLGQESFVETGAPLPPARPGPNPPALWQASEPVRVNELEFQVLATQVWPAPAAGGLSPLQLQLRVTNRGKENVLFLPILGQPVLQTADGKPLEARNHGRDGLRRLPDKVTLEPGKPFTVTEPARLFANPKGLSLGWMDETGSYWSCDGLQPGKYLLSLRYSSTGRNGEWAGKAQTVALAVTIRELKASPPVTANALEVCALADGVWRVPAEGQQMLIELGFRLTNAQKPNWARLFPGIAAVQLKASDGKELPVSKAGTVVPEGPPLALHMEPGVSRTLAQPAVLSHAGGALALTWVDSGGTVWRVEGLRPGKYTLRCTIQAQPGKTPAEWTTWTGQLQTEPLEVEITPP